MRHAIRSFTSLCLLAVAACAATTPVAPVGARDLPLLFKGEDFARTDIAAASGA